MKIVGATEFKTHCLRILDEVQATGEPVTERGKPVAVVKPTMDEKKRTFFLGALRGSVMKYERPFDPAVPDDEIFAAQGSWGAVD